MKVKLLWIALIAGNLAWFTAYRIVDRARVQDIGWRHQAEQQRDFWQDQATRLNADMAKLCLCRK